MWSQGIWEDKVKEYFKDCNTYLYLVCRGKGLSVDCRQERANFRYK